MNKIKLTVIENPFTTKWYIIAENNGVKVYDMDNPMAILTSLETLEIFLAGFKHSSYISGDELEIECKNSEGEVVESYLTFTSSNFRHA